MSHQHTHDVSTDTSPLIRETTEAVHRSEAERTRDLIRASAEHAAARARVNGFSQAELNRAVEAAEEDLRRAREKRAAGEERAGSERRRVTDIGQP